MRPEIHQLRVMHNFVLLTVASTSNIVLHHSEGIDFLSRSTNLGKSAFNSEQPYMSTDRAKWTVAVSVPQDLLIGPYFLTTDRPKAALRMVFTRYTRCVTVDQIPLVFSLVPATFED